MIGGFDLADFSLENQWMNVFFLKFVNLGLASLERCIGYNSV